MCRTLVLALMTAALYGVPFAVAHAQGVDPQSTAWNDSRRYLDYYVSRYRLAWSPGDSPEADAVGGRLMWSVASLLESSRMPWLDRTLIGGYLTHTPEDADHSEILRYGAQVDYIITSAPLGRRVEPLVSLAAGAVRVTEPGLQWTSMPYILPAEQGERWPGNTPLLRASLPDRTWTAPSVTPGVGARIRLLPGISLRTDARQVIDFHDGITRNLELSGGISVGL